MAAFSASERVTQRYVAYHLHHGAMCTADKRTRWFWNSRPWSRNRCGKPDLAIRYSDVQTKEACDKDDNYHYADDVENIHCVFRSRYARFQYESAALE